MHRGRGRVVGAALGGLVVAVALSGLGGCSKPDDMCQAIKDQFAGVNAPASLTQADGKQVDTALATQLAAKYAAVAEKAPAVSKSSWSAMARFWSDYAAAAGDTEKLAELQETYATIADDAATVKADAQSCQPSINTPAK